MIGASCMGTDQWRHTKYNGRYTDLRSKELERGPHLWNTPSHPLGRRNTLVLLRVREQEIVIRREHPHSRVGRRHSHDSVKLPAYMHTYIVSGGHARAKLD